VSRDVEIATGKVVHQVAISGDKSESQVQKVLSGMLHRIDTDKYRVEDSADDKKAAHG
jgi:hypothetical protein